MSDKLVIFDETQYKVLKIRIYPNQDQTILINKTFGSCRKLYNEHLQERNEFYIDNILPIKSKATKTEISQAYRKFKPKSEKEWKVIYPYMKEVSSCALQQARMDCDQAFVNFFKSNNGTRKGKSGFPKFKSKHNNHQSYREVMVDDSYLNFEERTVKIPKIGKVYFKDRKFPAWWDRKTKLCSMTIEKNCSNQYFAAILFEVQKAVHKIDDREKSLGMDFSPSEMYINSDGLSGKDFGYVAQKQAHHKQLRKLSRRLAKKQKGSNNRNKARIKLARLEEHIANSRKDWIEKESLRLVRSYEKIVVEDLNLKGISKFLRNAKNINDTSWATFISRLQAKGKDYKCNVIKADRYFPSSQLCSKCGFQYKGLKLSEREWTCCNCGTHHIRDVNAAINLKNYVPLEEREFTPVESSKVAKLAELALQATELDEAGNHLQATSGRNIPGL
jgi:putative transposase